jgi:hypothetical protein
MYHMFQGGQTWADSVDYGYNLSQHVPTFLCAKSNFSTPETKVLIREKTFSDKIILRQKA